MSTATLTDPTPSTTPPTTTTQSRSGRQYPLTWLRALAALSVLTFHAYQHQRDPQTAAWPFSGTAHQVMLGTDLFVDMFFVLSAFVLWAPVARAALDGLDGRPGWVVLFRRSARLVPLYVTVVAIVWAVTNPSLPGHWQDLLMHLTFTQVYSDQYIFWTDGPAWSLAVEFHFYVLIALSIPLVRAVVRRSTSRGARLAAVLALPLACAVGGGLFLWHHVQAHTPGENYSVWFSAPAKAPDFAFGMALAVASAAGVRLPRAARWTAAVVGLGGLALLVLNRPFDGSAMHVWNAGYAAAIAVALSSIVLHDGPWPAWMSWRPLVWLGGFGYGIYLIHEPVLRLADHWGLAPEPATGPSFLVLALLVAVPTTALAWLSSRTVEAGGLKLLSLVDRDHRARDYYPHVPRHAAGD